MIRTVKKNIELHFKYNFKYYLIILLIYIIGIIIGAVSANYISPQSDLNIYGYINDFLDRLKTENLNSFAIFTNSFLGHIKIAVIIWVFGVTIAGIPLILFIIGYKGFALSFTFSIIIKKYFGKGFLFLLIGLVPQILISIPTYIFIAAMGLKFSKTITNICFKKHCKPSNIKLDFLLFSLQILFSLMLLAISSYIEGYLSAFFIKSIINYIKWQISPKYVKIAQIFTKKLYIIYLKSNNYLYTF